MCTKNIKLFTDKDQKDELIRYGVKHDNEKVIVYFSFMDVIYKMILVNLFGPHPHQSEFKGIWAVKYFQGLENQQEMKSSNNYLLKVTQLKRGRNDFSSLITSKTKA